MHPFTTDLFALLCWPLIAAGALIIYWASRMKDKIAPSKRSVFGIIALTMLFGPVVYVFWKSTESAAMVFNTDLVMIALGGSVLAMMHLRRNKAVAWRLATLALVGVLMIGVGGWKLIGDFVLPREFVDGTVIKTSRVYGYRRSTKYYIQINWQRYATTAEVYDRFQEGARIRAEIGIGSHTVLHATPL